MVGASVVTASVAVALGARVVTSSVGPVPEASVATALVRVAVGDGVVANSVGWQWEPVLLQTHWECLWGTRWLLCQLERLVVGARLLQPQWNLGWEPVLLQPQWLQPFTSRLRQKDLLAVAK